MNSKDIIKAANKLLVEERQHRQLSARGHFVLHINITKKLGQYKEYTYKIHFVDNDLNSHDIEEFSLILPNSNSQEEENIKEMDFKLTKLLMEWFAFYPEWKEQFIQGTWK